ncbi:MAG TPA: electron-transfer flavoprotein:ubiquinone oxidoreductase [Gemmatimonadales bacterium]|nr:electron-transfer flavoprotein:ubiquinone oxidoreductase [Gemmatimonadales bacterium]
MTATPIDFQPRIDHTEYLAVPEASPDERIEVGVLFVGAGPAGLAGAIRLAQLLETAPDVKERLGDVPVAVVEKGKYPGAHLVSGAVVNPVAFRKLFPGVADSALPFRGPVSGEALYLLTEGRAFRSPLMPPTMRNHGNWAASISEISRWLAERAEQAGVTILAETAASKLLVRDGAVRGVLTGDKGRGRDGTPEANFEPGAEIVASATVIAEGVNGHLAGAIDRHFHVAGSNPQVYALGVKEVWDVPRPLDRVIHTMGWPLRWGKAAAEFGGSFIYPMGERQVAIGLVVGLDYSDASLSVHDLLQQLKLHPLVRPILEGGTRAEHGWGAKSIPEGGFFALPGRLSVPGAVLTGDSAGFVNVPALKGIHYAMWSGMLAAEAIFACLKAGRDPALLGALGGYDEAVRRSFIWSDLHRVRNMRQAFGAGLLPGAALAGLMTLTGGAFPGGRLAAEPDAMRPVAPRPRRYPKPDGELTFDKLSSVYASGNRTRDTQPNHLLVKTEVPEAIGTAWINMCPAGVYEWVTDERGERKLRVNAPNCVQCGAISAKGGRLTPPEGGSGPEYTVT